MKFNEKLKALRLSKKLTQIELSNMLGISMRSLTNYEKGYTFPKREDLYLKLSEIFNVDIRYLKDDNIDSNSDVYTRSDIHPVLNQVSSLFSGGNISEKDKDALMKAILDVYWETKNKQNDKIISK